MIRSRSQRIADTLATLDSARSGWLSVGRRDGSAHLIPLSCCWDGEQVVIATLQQSVSVNSMRRTGRARFALPSTDDVVIIDATATIVTLDRIDAAIHRLFTMAAGFDPAGEPQPYVYILLVPDRIQAWRNERELAQREIMRDGVWIDSP
jgi:hypothetical protein